MRTGTLALALALLAACGSTPKADPGMSKPVAPAAPSAPAAPKPVVPAATAVPAAPKAEAKPVTADLSKGKVLSDNAALFGYDDGNGRFFFHTAGPVEFPVKVDADGTYEIAIKVSCDEAMGQKAKFTVAVDGQKIGGELTCTTVDEKEYVVKAEVKAGDRKIAVAFLNDLYKENEYDLNMYVSGLTLRPAK